MITNSDIKIIENIKKYIDKDININETQVDWEKVIWLDTLDKLVNNLQIAPNSYRECTEDDLNNRFYTAECNECGWWGSSKLLGGGYAIADTGGYADCTCPVCGNNDIDEKEF